MEILNPNGTKVYNLASGKLYPNFLSASQKKKLSKDENYRKRVELMQDFNMRSSCQRIKMTEDGQYIVASGVYPPMIKTFDTSQLSMKFSRNVGSEVVQFQILSQDFSKLALLESDRNIEFHTQGGFHYKTRIPKYGRDMTYHKEYCELYIVGSTEELYRFNLIQGQFYESYKTSSLCNNCIGLSPAHQLIGIGGDSGIIDFYDPRDKNTLQNITISNNGITSLRFNNDGLGLSVGTEKGLLRYYDIRMILPLWEKQYQYELPIVDIKFVNNYIYGADSKVLKIWDYKTEHHLTTIETVGSINDVCVVPDSGLCFVACEYERILPYYIPTVGNAPKWCSFLENITEELEEEKYSIYSDYKFITKQELENLGITHLIGTKLLRAYMHGYFMDYKLYNKITTIADPDAYERWRKDEIRRRLEEKKEKRIIINRKVPTVNKEYAEKLMEENKPLKKSVLEDDRFKALFEKEEFKIDENSEEYKALNPFQNPNKKKNSYNNDSDLDEYDLIDDNKHNKDNDTDNDDGNNSDSSGEIFDEIDIRTDQTRDINDNRDNNRAEIKEKKLFALKQFESNELIIPTRDAIEKQKRKRHIESTTPLYERTKQESDMQTSVDDDYESNNQYNSSVTKRGSFSNPRHIKKSRNQK